MRTSDEDRRKIDDALRRLTSSAFAERETAGRELSSLGLPAYLRLLSTRSAAVYGGQGSGKWLDTGVRIAPYVGMRITATGQVDLWPQQPGQYMTGPDGMGALPIGRGGPGVSGGALMGRIGPSGASFQVGSRYVQAPKDGGNLMLQIAPSPWGNPSAGEFRVSISTGGILDDLD